MTPLRKREAANAMPQSITDVEAAFVKIAELNATLDSNSAAVDAHVAELHERLAQQSQPIRAEIDRLTAGIQGYCETRRGDLTKGGKAKMFKFATGTVQWRKGRVRVEIDGDEAWMIDQLKALGLSQFVRLTEALDKVAILKSPQRIAGVPGLRVVEAPETISVEPHKS